MKYILDTNVLMHNVDALNNFEEILLPIEVLEELDKLKFSSDASKSYHARTAIKAIDNCKVITYIIDKPLIELPFGLDDKVDNRLLLHAIENHCTVISNDINVLVKCKAMGINSQRYIDNSKNENTGYIEVELNHIEQSWFYEHIQEIDYDMYHNQYLLIKDSETGEIIDKLKYTVSNGLKQIKYKTINSKSIGKVKPKNTQQELLFDMLQDDTSTIKVCTGKFGSGKDFVMLAHAISMIENEKYKSLIWVRNNVEVKNSREIGFLPGSITEKLFPYAAPIMDHVGGEFGLKMMIESGKVELQHLGFIRGRDIKNSIIYCSEAENMSKEHVQLLMGRCGENTILYMNGDFKQVDDKVFESNSGLNILINRLEGHKNFGFVKLEKTERSETAGLADLLD